APRAHPEAGQQTGSGSTIQRARAHPVRGVCENTGPMTSDPGRPASLDSLAGTFRRTEEREQMAVRVGINGFGRIGRNFFRALHGLGADVEIVALNDLGDAETMAHLLRYDSNLGPFPGPVELSGGAIHAAGQEMKMLSERDPAALPWGDLGVDVVL